MTDVLSLSDYLLTLSSRLYVDFRMAVQHYQERQYSSFEDSSDEGDEMSKCDLPVVNFPCGTDLIFCLPNH